MGSNNKAGVHWCFEVMVGAFSSELSNTLVGQFGGEESKLGEGLSGIGVMFTCQVCNLCRRCPRPAQVKPDRLSSRALWQWFLHSQLQRQGWGSF